jgi:hypothetical protein
MKRGYRFADVLTCAGLVMVALLSSSVAQAAGPFQFLEVNPPCRVVDTREPGQGGILTSDVARLVTVQGVCGVPAGASAAVLNITAVQPTNQGRLTAYPAGISVPLVSSLNFPAGTFTLANGAIVPLAATTPDLSIMPFVVGSGQVHMVIDVTGYFITPSATTLPYHSLTPCRIVDTRLPGQVVGEYGPVLQSGTERTFPVKGNCGVPAGAKAATLNVTAVAPTGQGRLTAYPAGIATPLVSLVNFPGGINALANGAIIPLAAGSPDLAIMPFVTGTPAQVHMVLDITGYFE